MSADARPPGSKNPAGWSPRLVAFDIDGTLVDRDGLLPVVVAEAVARVRDAGVPIVLATGRSWHGVRDLFDALELPPGPAVCSNGAVVVHYPPERIVRAVTFDPREVIAKVTAFSPQTLIAVEEIGRGYRLNRHFPPDELTGEMVIEAPDQLGARPVTRVILRDPGGSDSDFIQLAEHLGLHSETYYIGWSAWLDIVPQGVNKATALAEVAAGHGVAARDVLAFGDGTNDLEMLRWAGRGVAIGDAGDRVRQAADAITDRFVDGGPVAELNRWFG